MGAPVFSVPRLSTFILPEALVRISVYLDYHHLSPYKLLNCVNCDVSVSLCLCGGSGRPRVLSAAPQHLRPARSTGACLCVSRLPSFVLSPYELLNCVNCDVFVSLFLCVVAAGAPVFSMPHISIFILPGALVSVNVCMHSKQPVLHSSLHCVLRSRLLIEAWNQAYVTSCMKFRSSSMHSSFKSCCPHA